LDESLWKEAIESVPDEEIVRLINTFHIPVNGFGTKVTTRSVQKARKMIEAQLKTPKKIMKLRSTFQEMARRQERLQEFSNKTVDEIWQQMVEHKKECLPVWILLADGTEECLDKARQLLERLKQDEVAATVEVPLVHTGDEARTTEDQDLQSRLRELQQELNNLKQQLRRVKRESESQIGKLENNLRTAKEQTSKHKERIQQLEKENETLKVEITNKEKHIFQLDGNLREIRDELAQRQADLAHLQAENARLKAELDRLAQASMDPSMNTKSTHTVTAVWNVAIIGDTTSIPIPSDTGCRITTFAPAQVNTFLESYRADTWDEVWLLRYTVTTRVTNRLRTMIPSEKLKVFESLIEFQSYLKQD
jgi:predicted  nucleic acid-binding Zn-ribbon protein